MSLNEEDSAVLDGVGPRAALLGTLNGDGSGKALGWDDPITENVVVGTTEIWEMHNFTEEAHPIHIRGPVRRARSPALRRRTARTRTWETGLKDTVIAFPKRSRTRPPRGTGTDGRPPGVGLGAIVSRTREITDRMFLAAADTFARMTSSERIRAGAFYPPLADPRTISRAIAIAVVREAVDSGLARLPGDRDAESAVDEAMWTLRYRACAPNGGLTVATSGG
jgi:hypothetical protein